MATINYYLDCRHPRKDGTAPVKVSINTKQGSILFSIGIYLLPTQWNPTSRMISKHPQKTFLNSHLTRMAIMAEQKLMEEQEKRKDGLTKNQITQILKSFFCEKECETKNSVEFVFDRLIQDKKRKSRTRELFEATLNKINKYLKGKASSITFDDIDVKWLKNFNDWMVKDCPSVNGRSIHLRNLRTAFNEAISEDITKNYPFRKFKIENEKTRKRSLTLEQVRQLLSLPLEDWQERYVDTFMLIIYLMGINGVDLLQAKPNQIVNGRLEYRRSKTGTLYSVKLEPEAIEIINKYKGKKHLLKFCDEIKDYRTFMEKMNRCMKSLIPGCTSYWARHTVATLAAELDISFDTIAQMLGHSAPQRKVTLVYINYDQGKIDKANRKVMDYILGQPISQ